MAYGDDEFGNYRRRYATNSPEYLGYIDTKEYCNNGEGAKCLNNCDTTTICSLSMEPGFGVTFFGMTWHVFYAISVNRTLVIDSRNWNYGHWFDYFDSPIVNCTLPKYKLNLRLAIFTPENLDFLQANITKPSKEMIQKDQHIPFLQGQ